MADTDIEQITETDLSVKLNGICSSTEQLEQSIDSQKTNKIIDKNEQNIDPSLNSDKSYVENRKSLSNCSNDGEDDCCKINNEDGHKINITHCKSNNSIIEDDQILKSENAIMNSDELCNAENSYGIKEINRNDNKEQIEVNDTEEQKIKDDKQMDNRNKEDEENELINQNDTESRSNKIKKLEDFRINLDKSVTIVKVTDPKQNSENNIKKNMKSLSNIKLTLHRSTRNINKLKSFSDKDKEKKDSIVVDDKAKISPQKTPMITKSIVVNDTKKSGTKQKSNKKEQTLVIDSNIGQSNLYKAMYVQSNISSNAMNATQLVDKSIQNSYNQVKHLQITKPFILTTTPTLVTVPTNITKSPIILPNLTDDMFVIETPSFIVPYIYEKPHEKTLKKFLKEIVKIKVAKEDEDENQCKEFLDKTNENNQKEMSSKKSDFNEKMDVIESENEVSGCKKKSGGNKENSFKNNENGDEKNMLVDKSKNIKKDDSKSKTLFESTDFKKSNGITVLTVDSDEKKIDVKSKIQSPDYFENLLSKLFIQIGSNLVHEYVQLDLSHTQRKKNDKCPEEVHTEFNKENDPFQFGLKKCELCNFKSESSLVMAHHLETPHMTANRCFRCNFCTFQEHSPHEILQHMNTHNIRGRLDRDPTLHQCPSCPFEISHKAKLTRHLFSCSKKYRPEINQAPPFDWEPPAIICGKLQNKSSMIDANAVYQATMSRFKLIPNPNMLQSEQQYNNMVLASGVGAQGHCTILPAPRFPGIMSSFPTTLPNQTYRGILVKNTSIKPINQSIIVPTPYSMNNHTYQKK